MDPDPQLTIIGMVAALAITFLVTLCYWSLYASSEGRLKKLSEDGGERAASALKMMDILPELSEKFSCLLAVCFAACVFLGYFLPLPIAPWGTAAITVLVYTAVGILIPKRIGMHKGDDLFLHLVGTTQVLTVVSLPFYVLPAAIRSLLLLPFGMHRGAPEDAVTEEEIMMLLDEGEETGAIHDNEREMIEGIFELDDTDAGDIMTHRTDIDAVDKSEPLTAVAQIITDEGYSRIPVYDEDIDDIVGVLFAKDLLRLIVGNKNGHTTAGDIMRPVLYVPEAMNCRDLIAIMREGKAQLAVVVDEYGGTSGIVSMEDVLETIVGNIQDEYDDEDVPVLYHDDGAISMDGTLPLDEVAEILSIALPDQTDYDTLGGLITDLLGRIPAPDENPVVPLDNWHLTVERVEDRRISRVVARPVPDVENNSPAQED